MENKQIKISGDIPNDATIFTACDSIYFNKYVYGFSKSIAKLKSKNLHIHFINPSKTDIDIVSEIKLDFTKNSNKVLTCSYEEVRINENDIINKVYYASSRYLIQEFFAISKCLIVDIDSIFLKNFEFPLEDLGFLFVTRPIPLTVKAGCFYYTKNAKEFIKFNNKLIMHLFYKGYGWFTDQFSLFVSYEKFKNEISIFKFEKNFLSKSIHDDPVLLANKKDKDKEDSEEFEKVYKEYL